MQPSKFSDVNINDLGLFSSSKYHIGQICSYCTSREEMMENVIKAFDGYLSDNPEDKWACYNNNLRNIMSCLGGNDYKQAHMKEKYVCGRPELQSTYSST
jgi:hypothetical protein